MINATVIRPKTDNIAIDSVTCPRCGSEMVRSKIDNPHDICGRTYICYNCGIEDVISPEIEEKEIFE